jgi:hypothetical protein
MLTLFDSHALSSFVRSADGQKASEKLWEELLRKLEITEPNIRKLI